MKLTLNGVIVPMISPLIDHDSLDYPGLERLISYLLGNGVNGIFILGSSGEGPYLSYRLRYELIAETCRIIRKQVPVWVGVTDNSFIETANLSRAALKAGADAIVLSPPYYFPINQSELFDYIQMINKCSLLPLILYNAPVFTKLYFEIKTLKKLFKLNKIIGIKNSSGKMDYFQQLVDLCGQHTKISLFMGREELLEKSISLGCYGCVCGGANISPKLFLQLFESENFKNPFKIKSIQKKIIELGNKIYNLDESQTSYIKGIKCSLNLLGICNDFMSEPFKRINNQDRKLIRKYLLELGILTKTDYNKSH